MTALSTYFVSKAHVSRAFAMPEWNILDRVEHGGTVYFYDTPECTNAEDFADMVALAFDIEVDPRDVQNLDGQYVLDLQPCRTPVELKRFGKAMGLSRSQLNLQPCTPTELKKARQSLGLSQSQLAPLLGYGNVQRISDIERGVRQPGGAVQRLLRAYLDGYRPGDWPE